ncbi:response regulator [Tautonia plasticadhaerens]|uniref:Transcriptional regulatory protein YycF n=1 Tax=Tautonia plasticadhaerens TaxID=2527974 RepID=A0A518H004_9BACT|nr:response regulator [Tautonia plasticadhaerens]QDV34166.1 Transcriptional regulatory protein YycF [Tautonia plasticadhaerens]
MAMETALIVEDDPDQAEMAASFLRLQRIEPRTAFDGLSGVELASERRPDLVLLDLMLPDIDGFEVCRRLRSLPGAIDLPVVMVTALHGDEYRKLGFRVGANAYLTKPYGPSDLYQAIDLARSWRDSLGVERLSGEIRIEMDSSPKYLREVNDFLVGLYRSTPLTIEQVQHLQQAVLEIGQNAVEWGNRMRVELPVEVTYRVFEDRVEIIIRDQGSGFDRSMLAHAATRDDPLRHMEIRRELGLREGGFGLLITRGMVDELSHNDAGNEVTLTKRFPADSVPDRHGQEA